MENMDINDWIKVGIVFCTLVLFIMLGLTILGLYIDE